MATTTNALLDHMLVHMVEDVWKDVWMQYQELVHLEEDTERNRRDLSGDIELARIWWQQDYYCLVPGVEFLFNEISYDCKNKGHNPEDLIWDPWHGIEQWLWSTEGIGCCNDCYRNYKNSLIDQAVEKRAYDMINMKKHALSFQKPALGKFLPVYARHSATEEDNNRSEE